MVSTNYGPMESAACITQEELRRLVELRNLQAELVQLRRSIRDRLLSGASVEHGAYEATIRTSEANRFSFPKLADLIGETAAADLKEKIAPTICRSILVSYSEQLSSETAGGIDDLPQRSQRYEVDESFREPL